MVVRADFQEAFEDFLQSHIRRRQGEGRRRLEEEPLYAERLFAQSIWYPIIPSFEHLHPEYELRDFNGKLRFIDFAWIRDSIKLAIEIDPYGTHAANISKWQHDDNLTRHNHLMLDGWFILRFSLDMIRNNPRECQRMIQQFFGLFVTKGVTDTLDVASAELLLEREVVRLAERLEQSGRPLRATDVENHLKVSRYHARKVVLRLLKKSIIVPGGAGRQRVYCYRLNPDRRKPR